MELVEVPSAETCPQVVLGFLLLHPESPCDHLSFHLVLLAIHDSLEERLVQTNMRDTNLDTPPVVIDGQRVAHTQLIVEAKDTLARVDEVPGVLPDVESNQV